MGIEYMAYHGAPVIGVIVNKVPNKVSYHTYDRVVFYVTKFFQTYRYTIPSIASPTATTATTTATESKHESQPSRMVSVYGFVKAFSDDDGTCMLCLFIMLLHVIHIILFTFISFSFIPAFVYGVVVHHPLPSIFILHPSS